MKTPTHRLAIVGLIALAFTPGLALAQPSQMPPMPNLEEVFFKQFDTNQDGVVSRDEFLKPTAEQFDKMDADSNGAIDAAEVKAFTDQMMQRMQEMQRQMQQHGMPPR